VIKLKRKVLCLDWDSRAVRIVVARVGKGRVELEDAHSHRLPEDVNAEDPHALGDFIQGLLRRHRLRHKWVVVDVPRERTVINRLSLPPTPTNEVAAAVRFQAMKELPFPLDTAALDYVVMERDEKGQAIEVLMAAVTIETLDRVRQTCQAAGLSPARIGLRPYANLVSVQHMGRKLERCVLFVDVGPGATEIDVFSGEALTFARSANVNVPVPGGATPDDSRVISMADIRELATSDQAVVAAVDELLVETTRTLQAFRATEPEAAIDEVVVAGGTGIEEPLAEALQERLGFPCSMYDPTGPLEVSDDEAPKLRSFSAALGLAWGLSHEGLLSLDFLNPKRPVPRSEIIRKRVRVLMLAASVVLIASIGGLYRHYQGFASKLAAIDAANATLWEKVKEKQEVQNRIDRVEEWAREAVWPDELLKITRLAQLPDVEPGEEMVIQELTLDILSRTPGITLRNVFASEWQVPAEFVRRLNALGDAELPVDSAYEAVQATWNQLTDAKKYHGKTDVRVLLKDLFDFREKAPDREKDRRKLLRESSLQTSGGDA
jgi:type IV pilus assembly protein PilM